MQAGFGRAQASDKSHLLRQLYDKNSGWDDRFEKFVAQLVAEFADKLDPKREACWIASEVPKMLRNGP
jgi:hypothetical protein